jgi:hypothetical protein
MLARIRAAVAARRLDVQGLPRCVGRHGSSAHGKRIAADADYNPAMRQRSILFVCLGNICRSPTAEAVFRAAAQRAASRRA